jgi:hypothetical protein
MLGESVCAASAEIKERGLGWAWAYLIDTMHVQGIVNCLLNQ